MFLLDTNVVSESRKAGAGKVDRNVAAWAADVPAASPYLSSITILDLEIGVLLVERRASVQGALHGGIGKSCRPLPVAFSPWTLPSPGVAQGSRCPIAGPIAIR